MGAIEHPPIVTVPGVPDHVLYTWIVMAVLIGLSFAATRHLELVPRGVQNLMEVVLEQFLTLLDDVIGHAGRRYLPLIATLGLPTTRSGPARSGCCPTSSTSPGRSWAPSSSPTGWWTSRSS